MTPLPPRADEVADSQKATPRVAALGWLGGSDANEPPRGLRRSRTWRVLSRALAGLVVAVSLYYLAQNFRSEIGGVHWTQLQVRPWALAGSSILTLGCVLLGGAIWQRVLRGLGITLDLQQCMSTHLLANLGGYVPGYAWKHLGKAYLTRALGVPGHLASVAVVVEFAGLLLSRAAVSAASLSSVWLASHGIVVAEGYLWATRVVLWGALVCLPWCLAVVRRRQRGLTAGIWEGVIVHRADLGAALGLMCVTWLLYGAGFALLLYAIHPIGLQDCAVSVFAASSSFLVSLIVFFVPAGLTVREGVITLVLANVVPRGVAALAAVVSRIVLVAAEATGALVGASLRRRCVDSPNG